MRRKTKPPSGGGQADRKGAAGAVRRKQEHNPVLLLQQQAGNRATGELLQRSMARDDDPAAVQARLGPGAPLETESRSRMESAFGTSFSGVRVHTDATAAKGTESKLLKDFAAKFPDAAKLIQASADAMKLVQEADAAGVQFGGYAEEGPAKNAWAYTLGDKVYVPKARTDAVVATSDFLFELNNAIRKPKFAALHQEAAKGGKGILDAKQYARKKVELEVEGMLRLGQVWFEMKKASGKGEEWDKYDADFFLSEYQAFKAGTKTQAEIVDEVLQRKYTSGKNKGKTVEQYYMDQYKSLNGGK